MTEPTDTCAELARRGHQVFTAAARAWEDAARSMVEAARRPGERLPDVRASLDAAFDFAAQMLAEQREFAKTVMAAGAGALAAERTVPDDGPGTAERSDVRPYATPGTPVVEKPAEAGEPDRQDDTTVPTEPPALPPAAEDRPDETAADAAGAAGRQGGRPGGGPAGGEGGGCGSAGGAAGDDRGGGPGREGDGARGGRTRQEDGRQEGAGAEDGRAEDGVRGGRT